MNKSRLDEIYAKFTSDLLSLYKHGSAYEFERMIDSYNEVRDKLDKNHFETFEKHYEMYSAICKSIDFSMDDSEKIFIIFNKEPEMYCFVDLSTKNKKPENVCAFSMGILRNSAINFGAVKAISEMFKLIESTNDLSEFTKLVDDLFGAIQFNKINNSMRTVLLDLMMTALSNIKFADSNMYGLANDKMIELVGKVADESPGFLYSHNRLNLLMDSKLSDVGKYIFKKFIPYDFHKDEMRQLEEKYDLRYLSHDLRSSFVKEDYESSAKPLFVAEYKLRHNHADDYGYIFSGMKYEYKYKLLDLVSNYGRYSSIDALISFAEGVVSNFDKMDQGGKSKILSELEKLPNGQKIMKHLRSSRKTSRYLLSADFDI